jgi:SAM-dependent methyltransferase
MGRDAMIMAQMSLEYAQKMRRDWDERARSNARHYIADGKTEWSDAEFRASGEATVAEDILTDMVNICQGKNPRDMRVLELGCGAGRVTRALGQVFGEVHGIDISKEMVEQARADLAQSSNVFIHHGDGLTLNALGDLRFDFAYSCCVFHHISSYDVIEAYVTDVARRLEPGALFKFEVQGCTSLKTTLGDTWLGVPFSEQQAREMAERAGFELRYHVGEGEERFWLWCFRRSE